MNFKKRLRKKGETVFAPATHDDFLSSANAETQNKIEATFSTLLSMCGLKESNIENN